MLIVCTICYFADMLLGDTWQISGTSVDRRHPVIIWYWCRFFIVFITVQNSASSHCCSWITN